MQDYEGPETHGAWVASPPRQHVALATPAGSASSPVRAPPHRLEGCWGVHGPRAARL